ncbi:MAG: 4-(cytidine 5'-diphospho)-2-C-methyl-D-erythritol kinase [Lentisphaeria bacterium]|nr:4-(cytidine 5'-diphospho)-2-C-methyl-D-erythritol kinase [Lentisphaeria bacterium]
MRCGAKTNLFLKVTGKRPDGYHLLQTLFLPLPGVADELTLQDGAPGVRCSSGNVVFPDNLVCRAAQLYAETAGLEPAWDFLLVKNIPIAAGLGGGSSDAAGALRLLNDRYGCFHASELAGLAVKLGADVPFFLDPRPAWASGIGEEFRYLEPLKEMPPVLVVNPAFPVSAKWAYTHLAPETIGSADAGSLERMEKSLYTGDWEGVAREVHNDLGFALYRKFPLLTLLRDHLLAHGALCAEVSGSGSSLFAIGSDQAACHRLAEALRNDFKSESIRVFESCTVNC